MIDDEPKVMAECDEILKLIKDENITDDGYIIDLSYGPTKKEIEDVFE